MAYIKKSYAYLPDGGFRAFNGHISRETAIKRGFESVTLVLIDLSGKRRSENRYFVGPDFVNMRPFI